jgi:Holliday junction resolvasome RuvABC endonuclease subunit
VNILALDLATRTGWAICENAAPILSGVQEFKLGRGESPGMRYIRFSRWLDEMLVAGADSLSLSPPQSRVHLVCYEQSFRRGGAATEVAGGLVALVQQACARYGIEHVAVPVMTLKKAATGTGKADKAAMVARAFANWPEQFALGEPPDDNQADALHLLAYARTLYA